MADNTYTPTKEEQEAAQATMKVAGNLFGSILNQTANAINAVDAKLETTADTLAKPLQVAATSLTPFTVAVPGLTQTWSKFAIPQNPLDSLASIASEVGNQWAATGLRLTTQDDNKAVQFATKLGATDAELKTLNEALNESAVHLGQDNSAVSKAMMGIIATKTPDKLIDAFEDAEPSMKPFLDIAREDPALMTALHNAASNDSTVLTGLQKMTGSKTFSDPEALTNALADKDNRQLFTKLLNKVAQDPNLKFDDAAEVVEAGIVMSQDPTNPAAQKRYIDSLLNGFGLKDKRAELAAKLSQFGGTPIEMLGHMWQDPHGFFDAMAEVLGGDPSQVEALKSIGDMMANFVGMYSEDPHLNAFFSKYGQDFGNFGTALSGANRALNEGPIVEVSKAINEFNKVSGSKPEKEVEEETKPAFKPPIQGLNIPVSPAVGGPP